MSDVPLLEAFLEGIYFNKPKIAAGSPRTKAAYRNEVGIVRRFFREKHGREPVITDLSPAVIEAAMSWQIMRGRGKPTANKLRRTTLAILRYAVKKGFVQALSQNDTVEEIKEPHYEPECWWLHEWETILEAAGRLTGEIGAVPAAVFGEALLRTVYNTGARISAVMAIQTDWVDLAGGSLIIKAEVQKDGEDQRVTLLPLTIEALKRLEAHGRLTRLFDDWPFDRNVEQWPALNRWLRRLLVDAGLFKSADEITRRDLWHKIRRTFATYITAKAGIATAQSMLGHSSLEVTKRYIDRSKLREPSVADLLIDPNPCRLRLFEPANENTG